MFENQQVSYINNPLFYCPITGKLMRDPVLAGDGFTYERDAIENWIEKNGDISYINRTKLPYTNLYPNSALKQAIQAYVRENKHSYEQECIEAIKKVDMDSILYLEGLGVNIHLADENGWNGLHYAAAKGSKEGLEYWIKKGISINNNSATLKELYLPPEIKKNLESLAYEIENLKNKKNQLSADPYFYAKKKSLSNYNEKFLDEKSLEEEREDLKSKLENLVKAISIRDEEQYCFWRGYRRQGVLRDTRFPWLPDYSRLQPGEYKKFQDEILPEKKRQFEELMERRNEISTNLLPALRSARQKAADEIATIEQKLVQLQEQLAEKNAALVAMQKQVFTGLAPLHIAIYHQQREAIDYLLAQNADKEFPDAAGATPIFWAIYKNDINLIRLLSGKVNLQAVDSKGNGLLHAAAQYADQNIINYLINLGLLYSRTNKARQTPAEIALACERQEISDFIRDSGERKLQQDLLALNRLKLASNQQKQGNVAATISDVETKVAFSTGQRHEQVLATSTADNFSGEIPFAELGIEKQIAQGGFGIVYVGKYHGGLVAIKKLINQNLPPLEIEVFKQECKIMAKLDSPYIVKLIGGCFESPHYALVMEYMPGGSLYGFLNKDEVISWPVRYEIALGVGEGVKYLHEKDIVHGDLKSLNILLDGSQPPNIKISDFGLSKIKISSSISTQYGGQPGGSLRWMEPELISDEGEEVKSTKSSDIYSFGMVLWEITARQIPFAKKTDPQVIALKLKGQHETISEKAPSAVAALIQWCWRSRADRPNAPQVVENLKANKASINRLSLNK